MPVVSPTDPEPRFHVSLTDGTDILSFVLYGLDNVRAPDAIRRFPVIQSALKTTTGEGRYSDLQFPYTAIAQDEWSAGFGEEDLDRNKSAYWDAEALDTTRDNGFFLSGLAQVAKGYRGMLYDMPDAVKTNAAWIEVSTAANYLASKVVADETFDAKEIELEFAVKGVPTGNFEVDVQADAAGDPSGVSLIGGYQQISVEFDSDPDVGFVMRRMRKTRGRFDPPTPPTITSGSSYWVIVKTGGISFPADTEVYLLGYDAGANMSKFSTDGSAWSVETSQIKVASFLQEYGKDFDALFFSYKNNMYFVQKWLDGATAGDVYMAGYRGCADSNAGNKGRVVDATNPFTGNDPRSAYEPLTMKLTAGPGSQEERPWRGVGSSAAGYMATADYDWDITHTVDTEYVIEGMHSFQLIDDGGALTKPVTDVAIVNDMVLFAQGSGNPVVAHREFNDEGAWKNTGSECWRTIAPVGGDFIEIQHDYKLGKVAWMAQNPWQPNQYGAWVRRDRAPRIWSDSVFLWGGLLETVTAAWSEYTHPNATVTYDNNEMKIVLATDFPSGNNLVATQAISSNDVSQMTKLKVTLSSNKDMATGGIQILLDNTAQCASPLITASCPAMRKDKDYDIVIDVNTENIDVSAIISVGIQVTEDKDGGHTIRVKSPIEWLVDHDPIECGKFDIGNITGIEIYDDPERLYVMTEGEVGYISGDKYNAVPLREMKSLRSSYNGRAHDVGGVYLYFGLGPDGRVQQYFRQTLNDIGPAKDKGLREDRRGPISALLTYPGDRLFVAIDGGYDNYSSILLFASGGWHEIYRAPHKKKRIHSLYIQTVEGQTQQRLWFSMDGWVMWVPITFNAMDETRFLYNYYGEMISPWIYMKMHDLNKVYKEVKMFSEDLSRQDNRGDGMDYRTGQFVSLSYNKDGDGSRKEWRSIFSWGAAGIARIVTTDPWTYVGDFYQSPVQSLTLGTRGITCRRMQLKYQVFNTDLTSSPAVIATVIKGYAIQDVKYGYALTTKLTEGDLSIDLEGDEVSSADYAATVELAMAKLDSWASSVTPLTLNAIYSPFDGKTVVLNAIPMQPIRAIPDDQVEEQFLQLTVEEL